MSTSASPNADPNIDRNANRDATPGMTPDERYMRQALQLAEDSIGLASPNPQVGCILVQQGAIVGQGAHHYDRKDHAEVVALREAGSQARGATAYVTLEPCSHTGRTPPCAEALLNAGIKRVVVATDDPNPLVNGRGLAMLQAAGIEVTVGVLREQARTLNDGFARWIKQQLPLVTLKAALSLDGRIAPPSSMKAPGSVAYITGTPSLQAVQKLRHASDAVLTGIGTALEDNPLLTNRSGSPRRRPLLRVVLDSHLRLPLGSKLVQTAQNDLLLCTAEPADDPNHRDRWQALEAAGVQLCAVPRTPTGTLDVLAILHLLAKSHGILNLLTEAGSHLNRALLEAQTEAQNEDANSKGPLADKLSLFYAPVFLGETGIPFIAGTMPLPLNILRSTLSKSGPDFRIEAYLRDPWQE